MAPRRRQPADPLVATLAEVEAIYRETDARAPARDCVRRTECCQFRLTGRTPQLTRGEALLAWRAFKATGRKALPERDDGACPFLHPADHRCLIYAARPFGCRTHFCGAAGGPYARRDVLDLIRALEAIDRRLGGDGPHALPEAIRRAL